eukprot:COSAG06_NODE_60020_length_272_cov_0.710983_1_plen_39_part_01
MSCSVKPFQDKFNPTTGDMAGVRFIRGGVKEPELVPFAF